MTTALLTMTACFVVVFVMYMLQRLQLREATHRLEHAIQSGFDYLHELRTNRQICEHYVDTIHRLMAEKKELIEDRNNHRDAYNILLKIAAAEPHERIFTPVTIIHYTHPELPQITREMQQLLQRAISLTTALEPRDGEPNRTRCVELRTEDYRGSIR